MFYGSIVAMITPFDEYNRIDEEGIKVSRFSY